MCLDVVNERVGTPNQLIQSGWKTFTKSSFGKLSFENFGLASKKDRAVPMDEWIVAEGKGANAEYGPGFHVYENEADKSLPSGKRRVFYRKVVARGRQSGCDVAVALELFVPSDENAWPPLQ